MCTVVCQVNKLTFPPSNQLTLPHGAGTLVRFRTLMWVSSQTTDVTWVKSFDAYAKHVSRCTLILQTKTCPYVYM